MYTVGGAGGRRRGPALGSRRRRAAGAAWTAASARSLLIDLALRVSLQLNLLGLLDLRELLVLSLLLFYFFWGGEGEQGY